MSQIDPKQIKSKTASIGDVLVVGTNGIAWSNTLKDFKSTGLISGETGISFDGTNTFSLTDNGSGWSYYLSGVKYSFTGNRTVVLPNTPVVTGRYFIYFDDNTGVLKQSTTPWAMDGSIISVATIWFNDTLTPKYLLSDERHSPIMDIKTQEFLHNVIGSRLATTPSLSGYTLNSDVNASKTFGISSCILFDQDISHILSSLTDPNGTATDYLVLYRTNSTNWAWKQSNMPFAYNIGNANNAIQYDNNGTMTDTTVGSRRFVNSFLLCSNIQGEGRFYLIPGRNQFTTQASALTEAVTAFDWTGLIISESVIAYRLTWDTNTPVTSQGKCVLSAVNFVNLSVTTNASALTFSGVYEPADSTIIKEADVQKSIVVNASKLELSGDLDSAGINKYYGTNGSNVKGYYDLPTAFSVPNSRIDADGVAGTGYGTINTKIRRSNFFVGTGIDITHSNIEIEGSVFTIETTGIYSFTYSDWYAGTAVCYMGISLNSIELTSNIQSLTIAGSRIAYANIGNATMALNGCTLNVVWSCVTGDKIRAHTNGLPSGTGAQARFTASRIV